MKIDMDNEKKGALFVMTGIQEHKFTLDLTNYEIGRPFQVSYGFDILSQVGEGKFAIAVGAKYEYAGKLILECWNIFNFSVQEPKGFAINDGKAVKLSNNFLHRFLEDAICTLRGIILVKTQGVNGIPLLPNTDVDRIIASKAINKTPEKANKSSK